MLEKRKNVDSEETNSDPKTLRMNYPEALTTKFETLKIVNETDDKIASTTNSVTVNPSASAASAAINADATESSRNNQVVRTLFFNCFLALIYRFICNLH